jgi:hypothetical protein
LDDAAGAAFEGATSFVEPVMQALPFGDAADGSNLTASGTANTQVIAAIAPALDAMLSNALAVTLASPVGVSQMSRLLEALGRAALARPEAGAAILNRLFEILGHLPSDDAAAPPARAKAALMAGRTAQAARQRVCAAVLGVCTAAPQVRLRRSRMIVFFPVSRPFFFLNPARLRSPSDVSTRCDVCCRARCLLPRAAASPSRPTFTRRPAVRRRGRRFFGILRNRAAPTRKVGFLVFDSRSFESKETKININAFSTLVFRCSTRTSRVSRTRLRVCVRAGA